MYGMIESDMLAIECEHHLTSPVVLRIHFATSPTPQSNRPGKTGGTAIPMPSTPPIRASSR